MCLLCKMGWGGVGRGGGPSRRRRRAFPPSPSTSDSPGGTSSSSLKDRPRFTSAGMADLTLGPGQKNDLSELLARSSVSSLPNSASKVVVKLASLFPDSTSVSRVAPTAERAMPSPEPSSVWVPLRVTDVRLVKPWHGDTVEHIRCPAINYYF